MEVKKAIQLVHGLIEQNRALMSVEGALRLLDDSTGMINSLVKRKEALEEGIVAKRKELEDTEKAVDKQVADRKAEVKVIMEDLDKQIIKAETRIGKLNSTYTTLSESKKQELSAKTAEMLADRNRQVANLDKQIATKSKTLSDLTGQLETIKGRL